MRGLYSLLESHYSIPFLVKIMLKSWVLSKSIRETFRRRHASLVHRRLVEPWRGAAPCIFWTI